MEPVAARLPPFIMVQGNFHHWRGGGLLRAINHLLVMTTHEMEGRKQPFGGRHRQPTRRNKRKRRSARLRCGKADNGLQATCRGRYARLDGRRQGASGGLARPRRGAGGVALDPKKLAVLMGNRVRGLVRHRASMWGWRRAAGVAGPCHPDPSARMPTGAATPVGMRWLSIPLRKT